MGSCICNIDNVSTHLEGNKGFPTNSLTVKNYATLCRRKVIKLPLTTKILLAIRSPDFS